MWVMRVVRSVKMKGRQQLCGATYREDVSVRRVSSGVGSIPAESRRGSWLQRHNCHAQELAASSRRDNILGSWPESSVVDNPGTGKWGAGGMPPHVCPHHRRKAAEKSASASAGGRLTF